MAKKRNYWKKAQEIFDSLCSGNNYMKTTYLDSYLYKYAKAIQSDTEKRQRKFQKYKRGSLVKVDYGIGIGSELSAPHYSIVLTKDDNPFNSKLTVIPITSKSGKNNVELPLSISRVLALFWAETGLKHVIASANPSFTPDSIFQIMLEQMEIGESPTEKALRKAWDKEKKEREEIKQQMNAHIQNMNKKSYIKMDNITTVSKYRIVKPLHGHDPVGKMLIPPAFMEEMDKQLKRYLLDN